MRLTKYLIFLLCVGCNLPERPAKEQKKYNTARQKDSSTRIAPRSGATSIEDLRKYVWSPDHPDTTGYLCEMRFADEYAMNFFHGQCIWFFFTHTTFAQKYQQVQLNWTYKTDCLLNMSFLEKANGAKRHPKHGDIFAIYRLHNDTTINVEYKFPEWVQKVNQIAKDSLFPQRLYLRNPGGS
jgi:hypothetical protein